MTKKKLKELYRSFFDAEGLTSEWEKCQLPYGTVVYEDLEYNIFINRKRSHGGICFHMFVWGPEFPIWEGSSYWNDDPELQGKVESAAKRVNGRHDLGKVNAYPSVTYSVEIRLQSPEQFKDFFYKAAHELKAVESDFMDELINIGLKFEPLSYSLNTKVKR